MRILVCCPLSYYGVSHGINLSYDLFVRIPRILGHTIVSYDYINDAKSDKDGMNDHFMSLIRGGSFDFVIIETADDQFHDDVLYRAKKIVPLVAWNSDDDFRWSTYSEKQYKNYSLMYTTSNSIYETLKVSYPKLRYSQWGCTGFSNGSDSRKDIDVSFCGSLKSARVKELREISEKGVKVYVQGKGSEKLENSRSELKNIVLRRIRRGKNSGFRREISQWLIARMGNSTGAISYEELHRMWNSSKILYTPLKLEKYQETLKIAQYKKIGIKHSEDDKYQCKSRIFEQGMSGAMMLLSKNDFVREYYDAGVEYEEYSDVEECVDKINYYLRHNESRERIAENYKKKTVEKHLWKDRFVEITKEIRKIL